MTPEQAEDAYWAVNFYYTPWPHIEDEELNRKAFVDVSTIGLLKGGIFFGL